MPYRMRGWSNSPSRAERPAPPLFAVGRPIGLRAATEDPPSIMGARDVAQLVEHMLCKQARHGRCASRSLEHTLVELRPSSYLLFLAAIKAGRVSADV